MSFVSNKVVVGLAIAIALAGSQLLSKTATAQTGPKIIENVLKPTPLNKDEDKTVQERNKKEYEKKVEEARKKQAQEEAKQAAIKAKQEQKKEAVDKKWKEIESSPYTPKKKEEIMNKFIKDYDAKNKS